MFILDRKWRGKEPARRSAEQTGGAGGVGERPEAGRRRVVENGTGRCSKLAKRVGVTLTELAVAKLGPVGAEMQRLMKDPGHVDAVLRDGARRAREIAGPILEEVYRTVGFLRP